MVCRGRGLTTGVVAAVQVSPYEEGEGEGEEWEEEDVEQGGGAPEMAFEDVRGDEEFDTLGGRDEEQPGGEGKPRGAASKYNV